MMYLGKNQLTWNIENWMLNRKEFVGTTDFSVSRSRSVALEKKIVPTYTYRHIITHLYLTRTMIWFEALVCSLWFLFWMHSYCNHYGGKEVKLFYFCNRLWVMNYLQTHIRILLHCTKLYLSCKIILHRVKEDCEFLMQNANKTN